MLLYEVLSILFAPILLCLQLPSQAESIIDFYREFTVYVDSLGYVCSFSVFDFQRNGNIYYGAKTNAGPFYATINGKMEQSFVDFKVKLVLIFRTIIRYGDQISNNPNI